MSQSGPILLITESAEPPMRSILEEAGYFPIIQSSWNEAAQARATLAPAAIIIDLTDAEPPSAAQSGVESAIEALLSDFDQARLEAYLPIIAIGEWAPAGTMALQPSRMATHLAPRLQAALRLRTLDATIHSANAAISRSPLAADPLANAAVLLVGRGSDYPALSAALGARTGVVGTLSIDGAAKQLNARPLDGIIIGQGFSVRMIDALLTIIGEQVHLRHLPIQVPGQMASSLEHHLANVQLPHLEAVTGDVDARIAQALPFIAQHARASMCDRIQADDAARGHTDPATGLLSPDAFADRLTQAIADSRARGAHLSIARMILNGAANAPVALQQMQRMRRDSARIIAALKRQSDFGTLDSDGSILVAFADTHLQNAHVIARRLASVLKHTQLTHPANAPLAPDVVLAALNPHDDAASLCTRLHGDAHRAAG